jgi:hypothetical protein
LLVPREWRGHQHESSSIPSRTRQRVKTYSAFLTTH